MQSASNNLCSTETNYRRDVHKCQTEDNKKGSKTYTSHSFPQNPNQTKYITKFSRVQQSLDNTVYFIHRCRFLNIKTTFLQILWRICETLKSKKNKRTFTKLCFYFLLFIYFIWAELISLVIMLISFIVILYFPLCIVAHALSPFYI